MNRCFDIIGIKGRCTDREYKYYLDDYGVSLFSLAKVADERFGTGTKLLESILERAWNDTLLDITFSGVETSKILTENEIGIYNAAQTFTGTKDIAFAVNKECKLVQFYIQRIAVKSLTGGKIKVEMINSDGIETLFDGSIADNKEMSILITKWSNDFTIRLETEAVLVATLKESSCACDRYVNFPEEISPIKIDFLVRCNKEKYLCRFADIIAPAVIHKACGIFWDEVYSTNRFSEFTMFKQEDAPGHMLFHDSIYKNKLEGDSVKYTKGQYQYKLAKISDSIPPPKCTCCNECKKSITVKNELP